MMYIRYLLSLRQVEELLFERGIDICKETVQFRPLLRTFSSAHTACLDPTKARIFLR